MRKRVVTNNFVLNQKSVGRWAIVYTDCTRDCTDLIT